MKERIDKFIEFLTTITKEESDSIENILKWENDDRIAFMIAKRIFEEKNDD